MQILVEDVKVLFKRIQMHFVIKGRLDKKIVKDNNKDNV
jgi:hypothetical protein